MCRSTVHSCPPAIVLDTVPSMRCTPACSTADRPFQWDRALLQKAAAGGRAAPVIGRAAVLLRRPVLRMTQ